MDTWVAFTLTTANNAAMNMGVQISLRGTLLSVLLDIYPEVEFFEELA